MPVYAERRVRVHSFRGPAGPDGLRLCACYASKCGSSCYQLLVALAERRDLSWQGTLFVLKHNLLLSNGSGIMIFFLFLACRNFETVEMADNQGQLASCSEIILQFAVKPCAMYSTFKLLFK